MGCRAHLFTSDFETPDYTVNEADICLQAKYTVPAFWPLLFSSQAYRQVMPIQNYEPEPEDTPTHFFIMERPMALELFRQRESMLFDVVPSEWKSLSAQFIGFLESNSLRYIHLDVGELATMIEEDGFVAQFKYTLDSLNRRPFVNPTGLFAKYRRPYLHDGWETLLELAGISHKKMASIKPWDLAGAGEAEVAPWDES